MFKSISVALLAMSLLAVPAVAGTASKADAKSNVTITAAPSAKLSPKVADAMARHGGRHHARGHHMRRHHHHMGRPHFVRRHHMHRHHHMRMYRR